VQHSHQIFAKPNVWHRFVILSCSSLLGKLEHVFPSPSIREVLPLNFRRDIGTKFLPFLLFVLIALGMPAFMAMQASPPQPSQPVANEATERVLRAQWRKLFDTQSFAELDSLADRLRTQRLRFQGGGWQLHVLYTILSSVPQQSDTDAAWNAQIATLQHWISSVPSSPTPRIALADTYLNFAWKARGSDFADAVRPEAWKLFAVRIREALRVLEDAEQVGRNDPEWYNAMLSATTAKSWDSAKTEDIVERSLSKEPGYFYIARVQANNLLPKWYGEPGDTERFVAKFADRIGGIDGEATYFFVAEFLLTDGEKCVPCPPPNLSWQRIRRGYAAIEHLYGTNNFEKNAYALMAMLAKDRDTARQAFLVIGDNWNPEVWETRRRFESARMFPYLKPVPLARPKPAQ